MPALRQLRRFLQPATCCSYSSLPFRPSPLPAEVGDTEAQPEELISWELSDIEEKLGEPARIDEEP